MFIKSFILLLKSNVKTYMLRCSLQKRIKINLFCFALFSFVSKSVGDRNFLIYFTSSASLKYKNNHDKQIPCGTVITSKIHSITFSN